MDQAPNSHPSGSSAGSAAHTAAGALALIAASALAFLLGVRTLSSPDLGYHLAYGDVFLQTGWPVDSNDFLYTLPPVLPGQRRPASGPGCWYDHQGTYRFANANWLAQGDPIYPAGSWGTKITSQRERLEALDPSGLVGPVRIRLLRRCADDP